MRRSRRVALSRWPSADSTRPLTLPRHSSNAALEDGIDVALRLGVDVPASDISDWLELAGMPGAPEGDRWALIEHPAHRKRQRGKSID